MSVRDLIETDKFEICQVLMSEAVCLYFNKADDITLVNTVHNAHSILRDLSNYTRQTKGVIAPPLWTEDSPECQQAFERWNKLTKNSSDLSLIGNFVKHADRDPIESIIVGPAKASRYLEGACHDFIRLHNTLSDADLLQKPRGRQNSMTYDHASFFLTWIHQARDTLSIRVHPHLGVTKSFMRSNRVSPMADDLKIRLMDTLNRAAENNVQETNHLHILMRKEARDYLTEQSMNFGQYDRSLVFSCFLAAPVHQTLRQSFHKAVGEEFFENVLWTNGLEALKTAQEANSDKFDEDVQTLLYNCPHP